MHDALAAAYATLGLEPRAPFAQVKRQYEALVRQWDPSRFSGDAEAVERATARVGAVIDAYATIIAVAEPHAPLDHPAITDGEREFGSRLTRDKIDEIVRAIRRKQSWAEFFTDDPRNRIFPLVVVAALAIANGILAWRHPYQGIPRANAVLANVVVVMMMGAAYLPLVWLDQSPTRTGWFGWARLGGPPRLVGWIGMVMMLIMLAAVIVAIAIG